MTTQEPTSPLLRALLINHFQSTQIENVDSFKLSILNGVNLNDPCRVVAVVGAGASVEANLPLGPVAAQRLRLSCASFGELVDREINQLSEVYRLNKDDFETILLALSHFDRKGIVDKLKTMFEFRYIPLGSYEILSHLLKHRFVDAVINFNFDELLDQSIEDEMGPGNYLKIISDGDCPSDMQSYFSGGRCILPLYIKPHGTASSKATMRFTRREYFRIPDVVRSLLERLFGSCELHLMVLGHNMQSFEFNRILCDKAELNRAHFHSFNLNHKPPCGFEQEYSQRFVECYDRGGDSHLTDRNGSLSSNLSRCWEKISAALESTPKRGIERHELISRLFGYRKDNTISDEQPDEHLKNYYWDRTIVELVLAISKAKGFVVLEQLTQGRAGRYWARYKQMDFGCIDTLFSVCKKLGLKQTGYSRDALTLDINLGADTDPFDPHIVARSVFNSKGIECLLDRLTNNLRVSETIQAIRNDELMLKNVLTTMYDEDEVEVSTSDESRHWDIFIRPEVIPTLAALKVKSRKLVEDDGWDCMLTIAETGEWLLRKQPAQLYEKRIHLIVADTTHQAELEKHYGDQIEISWIPWWLHNQHMTLFLRKRQPLNAIYFERRMRSTNIAPIFVQAADADVLLDIFVAYWIKSLRRDPLNSMKIDRAMLENHKQDLLNRYYPETADIGSSSR